MRFDAYEWLQYPYKDPKTTLKIKRSGSVTIEGRVDESGRGAARHEGRRLIPGGTGPPPLAPFRAGFDPRLDPSRPGRKPAEAPRSPFEGGARAGAMSYLNVWT
jgi:hypothetical protein